MSRKPTTCQRRLEFHSTARPPHTRDGCPRRSMKATNSPAHRLHAASVAMQSAVPLWPDECFRTAVGGFWQIYFCLGVLNAVLAAMRVLGPFTVAPPAIGV